MVNLERLFGVYVNKGVESAIENSTMLFDRAKEGGSIKIVAGELKSKFYNDSKIIEALERAIERKVKVDIMFGPNMDSGNDELLKLWEEGKINLWYTERRSQNHFTLIDDVHARVESIHLPGQKPTQEFVYKTAWLGKHLADEFVQLQLQAKQLSPKNKEDKELLLDIQKTLVAV